MQAHAWRATSHDSGRRKNGATLKLWPGMSTTFGAHPAGARHGIAQVALEFLDRAEFEDVVGARVDEHQVGGLDVEAVQLLDHVAHARAGRGDVGDAGIGKAAAMRPAVDSAGSAPTPKAVLSPATMMVRRQLSGTC